MKLAVALSGGIDSSVAIMLLRRQGYDVTGFTLRLFDSPKSDTACDDSKRICEFFRIPHHVIDLREEFRKLVISDFVDEYSNGRTPNPCVRCNERIKFGWLRRTARELGCEVLATGHYARVFRQNGSWGLFRGLDETKDQSYALYRLDSDELSSTLFPIGDLSKWSVRQLAATSGMPFVDRGESQDICFIETDYSQYLTSLGIEDRPGNVIDLQGNVLVNHTGIHKFTIGQRKNLGLPGGGGPFFVVSIDANSNTVTVGKKQDLLCRIFTVENTSWLMQPDSAEGRRCQIKVRYRSPYKPGVVCKTDTTTARIELDEPQESVTPGQSAVFYDGDRVLGGGIISSVQRI